MNEKILNNGVELGRIAAMTAMTDKDDGGTASLAAFVKTLNYALETEPRDAAGDLILGAVMSLRRRVI